MKNGTRKKISFWFVVLSLGLGASSLYATTETKTMNLFFEVRRAFNFSVTSDKGFPGIQIGPVAPGQDAGEQVLQVSVLTNSDDRYRVYQELRNQPIHSSGEKLPDSEFQFSVSGGSKGGHSEVSSFEAVKPGKRLIFSSSPGGGQDTFSIHYRIANVQLFESGEYYGNLNLSVETD
jgi:hypothetical protein